MISHIFLGAVSFFSICHVVVALVRKEGYVGGQQVLKVLVFKMTIVHASYLLSLSYADLAVGGGFLPL